MMSGMGLRRLRAAGAAGVASVALLAVACTGEVDPPDDPGQTPESAALRVQAVTGADRLDERTRAEIEGEVGEVLSAYVLEAFLGTFPREEFVRSFESFTGDAARYAARDIDRLTAASVVDATSVRATELEARLSFLTQGRTVHGGTAHVHLAFEATLADGSTQDLTLDGRIMLVAEGRRWSVYGYDVRFDDGVSEPVEAESEDAS
jgi:hypothetical protein